MDRPGGAVAAAVLVLSTVAFFRVALLPAIGLDLALRPGLLSLLTVVFGVGRLLTDVPAGRIADRVAPLRALSGSAVGLVLASVLLAAAHSLTALLLAAVVLGVASASTNTVGMAYFTHGPTATRGKSLAVFSAALLGGQSLGPGVAGVLSAPVGWRTTEIVGAFAAAVVALACVAMRGPSPRGRATGAPPASPPTIDRSQLALLYAVSFSVFFALGAMPQTLLPLIGSRDYGLQTGVVGLLLGVGGLCRFVGAAIGGFAADRWSRKGALVPSLMGMGAGAALLVLPGGPVVWVSSVVLLSLGSFGVSVGATMLGDLGGGVGVGRRLGAFRFAGDSGVIAGPLVAGWLYDTVGTAAAVAAVGGVLGACALVSAVALRETRHLDVPVALDPVG